MGGSQQVCNLQPINACYSLASCHTQLGLEHHSHSGKAAMPLTRQTRSSIFLQLRRSLFITLFAQTVSKSQVEVGLSCPATK